jgi:hypothetical protein
MSLRQQTAPRPLSNAFVLAAIRQQKVIVVERLKEATTIDNSFDLAKARFLQTWLLAALRNSALGPMQSSIKCKPFL